MPHIHPELDFCAVTYIVNDNKVLLCHHIKLGVWVPPGGHVEPGETIDAARDRENYEETGLDVTIIGPKPGFVIAGMEPLVAPRYTDVHPIACEFPNHRHQAFVYFGTVDVRNEVLQEDEHHELRWFSMHDLERYHDPEAPIPDNVSWYASVALEELGYHGAMRIF
ncbi:MAG: NUDIX domain-containing protein [Candidatus Saccharibacteria bacterium]